MTAAAPVYGEILSSIDRQPVKIVSGARTFMNLCRRPCATPDVRAPLSPFTVFSMIDRDPEWSLDSAIWRQVYVILKGRITSGVYKPRYPVPSLRQLEQEFGVAKNTIIKALRRLREERYVRTEHGVGTFVRPTEDWRPRDEEE